MVGPRGKLWPIWRPKTPFSKIQICVKQAGSKTDQNIQVQYEVPATTKAIITGLGYQQRNFSVQNAF